MGTKHPGELIVIGSGLGALDFLGDSKRHLDKADAIFFVVADPVTRLVLKSDYPNAVDLAELYREDRLRYDTYIYMAEIILQRIRKGERVTVVFYGHPGVFATATHRAISIARSEGYRAIMRPGVSAMDYLVADLGFDPALPGLLSYEATDMILRNRRLDTTLHTVIWQVGVVGETGFKSLYYENSGFDCLLDFISRTYGPQTEIAHYIAAQFPDAEPLIERRLIEEFRAPEAQARISAKSTFYLAPKYVRLTEPSCARALGHLGPQETLAVTPQLDPGHGYSEYDRSALMRFDERDVGRKEDSSPPTLGARFLLTLAKDQDLASLYATDPAAALTDPRFSGISAAARSALVQGGAENIAHAIYFDE